MLDEKPLLHDTLPRAPHWGVIASIAPCAMLLSLLVGLDVALSLICEPRTWSIFGERRIVQKPVAITEGALPRYVGGPVGQPLASSFRPPAIALKRFPVLRPLSAWIDRIRPSVPQSMRSFFHASTTSGSEETPLRSEATTPSNTSTPSKYTPYNTGSLSDDAELLIKAAILELPDLNERFKAADAGAASTKMEVGSYGEFPIAAMQQVLDSKWLANKDLQVFVDIGSGLAVLALGVAALRPKCSVVYGIEALPELHGKGSAMIQSLEAAGKVASGRVVTAEGYVGVPLDSRLAQGPLKEADIVFCYSTSFPSEDGLRLPELSAALSASMKEGALAIVTDKWLVGERFRYIGKEVVLGSEGENILATLWQAVGKPSEDISGAAALAAINADWMGEDACGDNPAACQDFLDYLESQGAI